MGRCKRDYSIERRIDELAGRILVFAGDNPLIFLDTGAIIDFEREIERWRLKDKRVCPDFFYGELLGRLNKSPIFVTDHVYKEVLEHHKKHRRKGNPEICPVSFDIATMMHFDYCDFLREVVHNEYDIGDAEYAVYWASKLAFEEGHKKKQRDRFSDVDRGLLAAALWARYTIIPSAPYENDSDSKKVMMDGRLVSCSIIISPDEHIKRGASILNSDEINGFKFGFDGLEVVTSRK